MLVLDHFVVAGTSRAIATDWVSNTLGELPKVSGKHEYFGTHNNLWGMGPTCYLETISIDRAATKPEFARWFGLDHFVGAPRLVGWILTTKNIKDTLSQLDPEFGEPVRLQRGKYKWTISVNASGQLPFGGYGPALIEWEGGFHPCLDLPDSKCRLHTLKIRHPQAEKMKSSLGDLINDNRIIFETGVEKISAEIEKDEKLITLQ
ncbi:MAG: VOC family protein [Planktomarina sp.]|nr:VOC family protein [Planktomarina sp.]